jgi:cobalt-zinc-cadmium efflux system membrane fusion protein
MKNISENNLTAKSAKILTQSSQSLISLRALLPIAIGIALFAVTLISCSEKKTEEPQEEEKSTTEVALTVSQYKTVGIETGFVEDRNLNKVIKANGYTTVPPQNSAEVSTLIGGTVKDIFVLEGTYVNKGKVLATIQNLEVIGMQEDYQSAVANVEYLQLEYNRQKTLSDENVNPRKTFQEVKAKLAAERARAQAAKNKLDALHVNTKGSSSVVPIVSPINGFVGKINIAKGAFANTGVSLF